MDKKLDKELKEIIDRIPKKDLQAMQEFVEKTGINLRKKFITVYESLTLTNELEEEYFKSLFLKEWKIGKQLGCFDSSGRPIPIPDNDPQVKIINVLISSVGGKIFVLLNSSEPLCCYSKYAEACHKCYYNVFCEYRYNKKIKKEK